MEKYQAWAEKVQKELQEHTDWIEQYANYAREVLENKEKIEQGKAKFRVFSPLGCYITLGKMKDGKKVYDLRYLGQSVGEIRIQNGEPLLFVNEKKAESSKNSFGYELGIIEKEPWAKGKKACEFRAFYTKLVDKDKMPRQKEHMVEACLFQELAKTSAKDKQLTQIQPIKFAGCYTHMKTAVKASKAKDGVISVGDKGGEIDMFCRRKLKDNNETRLTVIEVKDKVEKNETFEDAMFQAIAYAVFIRELIHTPSGIEWMKIWGMNRKKLDGITINAVVSIPIEEEPVSDFHGQKIVLGNDKIALYSVSMEKEALYEHGEVHFETKL